MEATMLNGLKVAVAVAARMIIAAHPACGQEYIVNGHVATATEVQYLTSHGIPAGDWKVDGAGYYKVSDAHKPSCWYVLDVLLCDHNDAYPVASR
jgi:hypothetical protein